MILKTEITPLKQVIDNQIEKDDSLALEVRTLSGDEGSGIYTPVAPDSISFFFTDTDNVEIYDFDSTEESFATEIEDGVYWVNIKTFDIGSAFFRVDWEKDGIKKSRKYLLSVVRNIPAWERGI